jgi:hypothetical protein
MRCELEGRSGFSASSCGRKGETRGLAAASAFLGFGGQLKASFGAAS